MFTLTQSLEEWLWKNHKDILGLVVTGHVELITPEMWEAYIEWCKTDEGKQYLKGGSKYRDDERNREIERRLEASNG